MTLLPDEAVVRHHLKGGEFLRGVVKNRWRLVSVEWPHVFVAVGAVARSGAPEEYGLRLHCGGYPQEAPTGAFWDLETNQPLPPAQWPGGSVRVQAAFRPEWQGGQALYLPCDRCSLVGHPDWVRDYPEMLWNSDRELTHYLEIVHELLHSPDYTGLRGS